MFEVGSVLPARIFSVSRSNDGSEVVVFLALHKHWDDRVVQFRLVFPFWKPLFDYFQSLFREHCDVGVLVTSFALFEVLDFTEYSEVYEVIGVGISPLEGVQK